jgi:hypothetical protein
MKQILFKAKREDNGEWVEGFYEYNKDDDMHFIRTYENRETIEVVPETVCEYSWLTDWRDVMIFDDDIRKDNEGTEFRIYRTFGGFVIKAKYWMSDIKDLVSGDELIFKSLSDLQLADWLINDTIHVCNIHD